MDAPDCRPFPARLDHIQLNPSQAIPLLLPAKPRAQAVDRRVVKEYPHQWNEGLRVLLMLKVDKDECRAWERRGRELRE